MKHYLIKADRGKVAHCRRCGCSEDELPTDCPAYKVDYQYRQAIKAGELDFKDDAWRVIPERPKP